MQIQRIDNTYSQSFKAVNQRYMTWAKEEFRLCKNVSTEWLQRLRYDVFLTKIIARQDAIDTIEAVKKYMNKTTDGMEELLKNFRNPNP